MPNWKKVITSGSDASLNTLNLFSVPNAGTDTDKFLVLDSSNNVDFRTGAEVRSDIGAGTGNGTVTGTGTNNQVMTSTGGTGIQGESSLTFDGETLYVNTQTGICVAGGAIINDSEEDTDVSIRGFGGSSCILMGSTEEGGIRMGPNVIIGSTNTLSGNCTSILGGRCNTIGSNANCSSIAGGYNHTINGFQSFIGGGGTSCIEGDHSVIAGGCRNFIQYCENFIGGGCTNSIGTTTNCSDRASVIVGGSLNTVFGGSSGGFGTCKGNFIGGGISNTIQYSDCATIVGGCSNCLYGSQYSFLGGGYNNNISNKCSVVVGGANNITYACLSSILGGSSNTIAGSACRSAILGGASNTISHNCSFIAGQGITTDKSNYFFVNNLDASGNIIGNTLSLTGLSAQNSEATAVMINGSNVVGTRELGSNAFNSTAFSTCTGTLTGNGTSGRVPIYNGTTSFTTDSNFTYSSNKLGIDHTLTSNGVDIIENTTSTTLNIGDTIEDDTIQYMNFKVYGDTKISINDNNVTVKDPILTGLSAQNSEATALMINGSNVVGTRELGSNAFNSTAFTTCTGTISNVASVDSNTISVAGNGTSNICLTAVVNPVTNGGTSLATGDQIYDHVTTRISGLTSCTGTSCLTLAGGVNNRIVTAGSTTSLIGESGLTYDGSTFYSNAQGNTFHGSVSVGDDNAGYGCLVLGDDYYGGELGLQNTDDCMIAIIAGTDRFEYASVGGSGQAAICAHTATACNYSIKLGAAATHTIESTCSTIGGGTNNYIKGTPSCLSFIGGGVTNIIESSGLGVVGGGWCNCITGSNTSGIVGGVHNKIKSKAGYGNFIGGGQFNQIWKATVAGGSPSCELHSSIVGGSSNAICNGLNGLSTTCGYNFIGGGLQNKMCYTTNTFIGGGCCNKTTSAFCSVIVGGCCNLLYNSYNFLGGGFSNTISCNCSIVVGGNNNSNGGNTSFIGGGRNNTISTGANCSSITAGYYNSISGCLHNSIGAGCQNCINVTTYGTSNRIGGGQCNHICGTNVSYNTIPGGWYNRICNAYCSTIAGGRYNCIKDQSLSTIGGGGGNYVCGRASTITGGETNYICNGAYGCASILGGCNNKICTAAFSSAVGLDNIVNHHCSHAIGAGLVSTTTRTTYMNNATVACHLQVGGTTTLNTTTGRIDATNDIVAYATSDRRLKENIQPINDALCKVIGVSGNTFDWKPLSKEEVQTIHGNTGRDVGVIAQEIEEVLPEAVTTRDNGYKAVNYEKIVPLLIEAIKEQQKQIDELKSKV